MENNENPSAAYEPSAEPDSGFSTDQLKTDIETIKTVLTESERDRDRGPHRVIIAAANFVIGILFLIIIIPTGAGFLAGAADAIANGKASTEQVVAMCIFLFPLPAAIALSLFLAGLGLFKKRNWGSIAAIVSGVLNLFCVPFGTALAIYTFWAFFTGKLPKLAEV